MSNKTANPKLPTDPIPVVIGDWYLKVSSMPALADLETIRITFQAPGEFESYRLFGRVDSPATAFALEGGSLSARREVTFKLKIANDDYTFTGLLSGTPISMEMKGSVKAESGRGGDATEDGSWSAQASGGGQGEDHCAARAHSAAGR